MKSVILICTLCLLGFSTSSFANLNINIDAQKDSFYFQLDTPDEGYLQLNHTEFLPFCGPKPWPWRLLPDIQNQEYLLVPDNYQLQILHYIRNLFHKQDG